MQHPTVPIEIISIVWVHVWLTCEILFIVFLLDQTWPYAHQEYDTLGKGPSQINGVPYGTDTNTSHLIWTIDSTNRIARYTNKWQESNVAPAIDESLNTACISIQPSLKNENPLLSQTRDEYWTLSEVATVEFIALRWTFNFVAHKRRAHSDKHEYSSTIADRWENNKQNGTIHVMHGKQLCFTVLLFYIDTNSSVSTRKGSTESCFDISFENKKKHVHAYWITTCFDCQCCRLYGHQSIWLHIHVCINSPMIFILDLIWFDCVEDT
jgi:hypothetical protein